MEQLITAILLSSIIYAQPPGGGQQRGQQGPPPIPNEKQIKEKRSIIRQFNTK